MKKLSVKYWNTLSKGSKERALRAVFPNNPATVEMMVEEKPNLKSGIWKLAFSMIRVPDADANGHRHYKTCVNRVHYA